MGELAISFLMTRLKALVTAIVFGLGIFLGIIFSTMVSNVGKILGRWLPLPDTLLLVTNLLMSMAILVPMFVLIFKYLPDQFKHPSPAWVEVFRTEFGMTDDDFRRHGRARS